MKFSKFIAAVATGFMLVATAQAAVVSALNPAYSFSWSYNGGAAGMLTGNGSMNFTGFGTADLTAVVSLNNTSTTSTNRLVTFGFGIDPNVQSVSFSDAADAGVVGAKLGGIPSMANIEVCAYSGPNCNGGGGGGIFGGASDTFTLVLKSASTWSPNVTIDPVGFKYQTGAGSFEFTPVTAVPETETYAMMLAGLGLMGTIARRRKNKAA